MIIATTSQDGTRVLAFHPPMGPHRVLSKRLDDTITCHLVGSKQVDGDPHITGQMEDVPVSSSGFDALWTLATS